MYLYPTLTVRISASKVPVCNTEDEAVKDDSDDDWQDDGHPNLHMWPDPVTPFLVLKHNSLVLNYMSEMENLLYKHCYETEQH